MYSSSRPLWSNSPVSPWSNYASSTVTPIFTCWFRTMKSPKCLGNFNFQFSVIIVSSFGTKTSRPVEHKVMGTGSKNFANGSLGYCYFRFHPLVPGFVNPGYGRNCHVLDADSERVLVQPPGEPCPGPIKYCHLTGAVPEASGGQSTILQVSCFRMSSAW